MSYCWTIDYNIVIMYECIAEVVTKKNYKTMHAAWVFRSARTIIIHYNSELKSHNQYFYSVQWRIEGNSAVNVA